MLMTEPAKFAYMNSALETLGERLRRCRIAAGLTQAQVGAAAGVSGAAVAQWESGDSKTLKPENLFKVARLLKKSAEWLVTGQGSETPPGEMDEFVRELPDQSAQAVIDFINYQYERAENLMASEKAAKYVAMIETFKKDLDMRKSRDSKKKR